MKKILLFIFAISFIQIQAQENSLPYQNKSIIKIKSISPEMEVEFQNFDVEYLSCRHHSIESEIIVNESALSWLNENEVNYAVLVDDLKQKIDAENQRMNSLRSQRDGDDWYMIYRTYEEVMDKMSELTSSSSIANLVDLGNSYEGRSIKGIKISTGGADKPAVFFNGCQHAREWISPMATTYLAESLLQNYNEDEFTSALLNLVDVYIVPIVNPDGYVYSHTSDRYWRKNRQPNSDSSCVGTDLNRNWDADWNGGESTSTSACSDIYVGTEPFSAVEASLLKTYMESIPNLQGHLDIHSYSALVLGPWGYSNSETPDHAEVVSLGNVMNDAITNTHNYPFTFGTGDANGSIYLASGTMPDWSYDELGALGYTFELRPNSPSGGGFELPEDQIVAACEENYNGAFEMIVWAADVQSGCMDVNACNYDAMATIDDGSCEEFDECGECGGNGPIPGYDCDGNCLSGEILTISMTDSYGDGWNGNTLSVEGMSFTFNQGYEASDEICYDPNTCYTVVCDGGSWQSEVAWEITNSSNEVLLTGGAPYEGELGNCSGDVYGCTDILAVNYEEEATIDDGSCEYENQVSQVINLPMGWFIFSTYIQVENPSIDHVLSPVQNSLVIAKNGEGLAYLPDWEYNGIGDLIDGEGYLVKLTAETQLTLSGQQISPETFELQFDEGWSMFAYLRDSSADLEQILSPIQENIVIVKTFDGTAYLPDWGFNGIGDFNPGEGYQIKVNANVSFTYPAN